MRATGEPVKVDRWRKPGSGPSPIPDPASFVAEPMDAEQVRITDPQHLAEIINAYALQLTPPPSNAPRARFGSSR